MRDTKIKENSFQSMKVYVPCDLYINLKDATDLVIAECGMVIADLYLWNILLKY
jgi:hypothetical protein